MPRDFLRLTMQHYWMNPAFALWRAVELRLLDTLEFPEPILDLGCGDGQFAEMLFGRGRQIVELDVDRCSVAQAEASGVYTRTVRSDAAELPFEPATFASVVSNCVMEHIPNDEAVLGEVARVLKPGGTFAFTVPGPDLKDCLYTTRILLERGDDEQARDYLEAFDRRLSHYHYRGRDDWTGLLQATGLVPERFTPYLPPATVALWNRVDDYLVQPVINITSSRRLALVILMPRGLRNLVIRYLLRNTYRDDESPDGRYGCAMLVARRL